MKACTMANGAVFFIPDEIERETKSVSYSLLLEMERKENPVQRTNIFSRFLKRDDANIKHTHAA